MHGLIRDIHDQRWRRNFENFNFLRGFFVCFVHYGYAKCEIMYHRLVLYLNMYYHLPFSCGTLLKSKNWFDVLNFRFSQLHDYSGYTIIRDSRVCIQWQDAMPLPNGDKSYPLQSFSDNEPKNVNLPFGSFFDN